MFARHFFGSGDEDIKQMLNYLGYNSLLELYKDCAKTDKVIVEPLNLPPALSEEEAYEYMKSISELNSRFKIFAGGGAYDVYTPRAIFHLLSRSEFYTAYTPYQPEVSQGTLQLMFEFQSLITELTKMDVSNASVYDGATALAEAVLMSFRITKNYKVIIPKSLNPSYKQVLKTYTYSISAEILEVPYDEHGRMDLKVLSELMDDETSAVVVQHPNYFGILEDVFRISELVKSKYILLISVFDPVSIAILSPPGDYDADIAVAEGQSLGVPLSFGGPYVGIFTSRKAFVRQMPGRIVGITYDEHGRRAFVSTLQAREQHIRREKATSNICTNQQLIATLVVMYLTFMGYEGLKEVALRSHRASEYLKERLSEIGIKPVFNSPTFREFVVQVPYNADEFIYNLAHKGFLVGPAVKEVSDKALLIATTERRTKKDIDELISAIQSVL